MKIKYIQTKAAPETIGPYSQAIRYGNFIFCAGQIGITPQSGKLLDGIEKQTEQVLKNLREVLKAADAEMENVVKTTVYLAKITDFQKMNEVYATMFGKHKPARATVEVSKLPREALVEIEAIAIRGNS